MFQELYYDLLRLNKNEDFKIYSYANSRHIFVDKKTSTPLILPKGYKYYSSKPVVGYLPYKYTFHIIREGEEAVYA